jgi:hypothetical protein
MLLVSNILVELWTSDGRLFEPARGPILPYLTRQTPLSMESVGGGYTFVLPSERTRLCRSFTILSFNEEHLPGTGAIVI